MIIGDLLIDRTYYVDVHKISPEAPVPVAMLTGPPVDTPGGAGLAAAFAAVDKIPAVFATYTSDHYSYQVYNKYKIPIIHVGPPSEEVNAIKMRYIDSERHYHLLRVDNDDITPKPFQDYNEQISWFKQIEEALRQGNIGILTLLDYKKGLLNEARTQRLIIMARDTNTPIYVDSRSHDLRKFTGATILKLNKNEFLGACKHLDTIDDGLDSPAPYEIIRKLNLEYLIVTCGSEGACIFRKPVIYTMPICVKAPEHEGSPDVTGCGDVFDCTFCYHFGINKVEIATALKLAVDRATQFAYSPIGERLQCQK